MLILNNLKQLICFNHNVPLEIEIEIFYLYFDKYIIILKYCLLDVQFVSMMYLKKVLSINLF